MHLIQFTHPKHGRRVGIIEEPNVILLSKGITSSYQLFNEIINNNKSSLQTIDALKTTEVIKYDVVYHSKDGFRIFPPMDCVDPMYCIISGTGLTHKASAENRQKMHDQQKAASLTDSMKMYILGEEGGKPNDNEIGVQPEWFYKGNGLNLKGHSESLVVPNYANDGGDEPEVAGVYLISAEGNPHRIGFVQGNEFSDHIMERKNYLYLAPSKLRNCSIGPELVLAIEFNAIPGKVNIYRKEKVLWSKALITGESAMAHSLANLEYHHFKYEQHRIPGQLHIHFFGAGAFSFGENVALQAGDEMSVSFENMGRPLVNPIHFDQQKAELLLVKGLL
jgi:hypothetical protein